MNGQVTSKKLSMETALAYLRTVGLACDGRDDRQSVTYLGQVAEFIRASHEPPVGCAVHGECPICKAQRALGDPRIAVTVPTKGEGR